MRLPAVLLFLVPSLALVAAESPVVTHGMGPLEGPTLFGDLGGLRSGFAEHGLSVDVHLIGDGIAYSRDGVVSGERRGMRYLLEAGATMDVAVFMGWSGFGSLTATWQTLAGDDLVGESGVLQSESWINVDDRNQIGRLFYRQPFFDGAFSVKFGKDEVVRDFARNPFASEFHNASARREPTAWAMPGFPDSATMAMVSLKFGSVVARGGVYDGRSATAGRKTGKEWLDIPDRDVFLIAEAGYASDDYYRGHQGGLVIGAWQHTGTFSTFDGGATADVRGYYVQGDLMLSTEANPRKPQGLGCWIQLGMTEEDDVSVYRRHLGLGLFGRGLIPTRDADAVGVSYSWLQTSSASGSPSDADERVLEVFYSFSAAGWLQLQPDFQWFVHPGGNGDRVDLYVGSLRGVVTF
jgi:porin